MPQQLPLNYPSSQVFNGNNSYSLSRQPTYNNYPQYTNYSTTQTKPQSPQTKPQSPQKNDPNNSDFHRFYGPVSYNRLFELLIL
jgi:hypothetical protein